MQEKLIKQKFSKKTRKKQQVSLKNKLKICDYKNDENQFTANKKISVTYYQTLEVFPWSLRLGKLKAIKIVMLKTRKQFHYRYKQCRNLSLNPRGGTLELRAEKLKMTNFQKAENKKN